MVGFVAFVKNRRVDEKNAGRDAPSLAKLQADWKCMDDEERNAFSCSHSISSVGSGENATADFLRKQQRRQVLVVGSVPLVRLESSRSTTQAKKRRVGAAVSSLSAPFFPKTPCTGSNGEGGAADENSRRKELALSLKQKTSASGSRVSVQSSYGADLERMNAQLNAPTLSFDWDCPAEEEVCANLEGDCLSDLAVDLPQTTERGGTRSLLRQELVRHISAAQVRELVQQRTE